MSHSTREEIERRYKAFCPPKDFTQYCSISTEEPTDQLSDNQLKAKFEELTGISTHQMSQHMNDTLELKKLLHVTIDVANSDLGRPKVFRFEYKAKYLYK